MISNIEFMGIVYLILSIFGIIGNTFLLYLYIFKFFTITRTRHIDPLIIHLTFVNITTILFGGIQKTMQIWDLKCFLDDCGGKTLYYFMILFWNLSICSPFLLSIFQAITISPNTTRWAELKTRASKYIIHCCVFCWIFNVLLESTVSVYITGAKNISKGRWNFGYSSVDFNDMSSVNIVILKSVYEGVLLGLMAIASGYMILVLYRHRQQVQHIHSISLTHRVSHEIRASKTILLLVITYICFNTVSFPFIIYLAPPGETRHWVIHAMLLCGICYPAVSPIILLMSDTQIHVFLCSLIK